MPSLPLGFSAIRSKAMRERVLDDDNGWAAGKVGPSGGERMVDTYETPRSLLLGTVLVRR